MRSRLIHLVNPKTDSLTTRPLYFNRALYSPIAGLLAVAIPVLVHLFGRRRARTSAPVDPRCRR